MSQWTVFANLPPLPPPGFPPLDRLLFLTSFGRILLSIRLFWTSRKKHVLRSFFGEVCSLKGEIDRGVEVRVIFSRGVKV